MTVAYGSAGTAGNGTTSVSVTCPVTVNIGDLLLACVTTKYPPAVPDTPAGWTPLYQVSGGAGSAGADSGSVTQTAYYKIAEGNESASVVTWNVAGGNTARAVLYRYTKDTRASWSIVATGGADSTAGTDWSVTGADTLDIAGGDFVVCFSGINTDAFTNSLEVLSATSLTVGTMTERADNQSTTGDDLCTVVADFEITSGAASGPPTYAMTVSGAGASSPAGATIMVRIRDVLTAPILYNNQGTIATGTTTISVASTGTTTAGEPLLLIVTGKYPTNYPSTPSGWTHLYTQRSNSGAGAGVDAGDTWCAVYYRAAPGGTVTFTLTVTGGNSVAAVVYRNLITSGYGFTAVATGVSMDVAGTAVSLSFSDLGIQKDDLLYVIAAENVDTATIGGVTVSVPGAIAPLINRDNVAVTAGDDHRRIVYTLPVNNTGAGGAVVLSCTASTAVVVSGILVRLRGVPPVTYRRDHSYSNGIARGIARGVN